MLRGGLRIATCAWIAFIGLTACQPETSMQPPLHLPPDLNGIDSLHLIEMDPEVLGDPDAAFLKDVLDIGKRNLDWLTAINKSRTADHQLSLTSKDRAISYPVEKPNIYNKDLVLARYQALRTQLPVEMTEVLYSNHPLPSQSKLDDDLHGQWGFKIDVVYQSAVRWLMMKRSIPALTLRRKNDIRGYYYLRREPDLETKLAGWTTLPAEKKDEYREALIGICSNTLQRDACRSEFANAEPAGVRDFWLRYSPASAAIWNGLFRIQWFRSDIHWTSANPLEASMPVLAPSKEEIGVVLKANVEDEWKWPVGSDQWQLKLNFETNGSPAKMTHIEFVSVTTPHVIPPNKIVMNADQPTTEYEYKWALRHEYGHILGFPDCYLEFYDVDQQAIVNYQLDTTDLMCSRQGVLKQNHFDEMKRVYFKDVQ